MTSPSATSAALAVAVGALILGATTALREIDVGITAAGFWRVALALPILFLIAALSARSQRRPRARVTRAQWRLLVIAGACFAGDLVFWHLSLVNTSLGNATFLATLSSLWVPLVAFFFLKQALSKRFVLGLICALLGSGILVSAHLDTGTSSWLGDVTACSRAFSLRAISSRWAFAGNLFPLPTPCCIPRDFAPQFYCHWPSSLWSSRESPCCPALSRDG